MNYLKFFFLVALVMCFINMGFACSSSSSGGSSDSSDANDDDDHSSEETRPHDIDNLEELTELYNKPVVKAERVERPMQGALGAMGFKHSGVRVTLEDGSQHLVHKGKEFGDSGQNVVTDAGHMEPGWVVTDEKKVQGARVGDYVEAGGEEYDALTDNCHHGSERMMDLGENDGSRRE